MKIHKENGKEYLSCDDGKIREIEVGISEQDGSVTITCTDGYWENFFPVAEKECSHKHTNSNTFPIGDGECVDEERCLDCGVLISETIRGNGCSGWWGAGDFAIH